MIADDLVKIKNKYGEEMMHFARKSFPSILETPGLLFTLFEKNFAFSQYLYSDIIENNFKENFIEYIYGLIDMKIERKKTNKTPKELLNEAGYDFYECKTEEEIQVFRKYYVEGEELCTFIEGNRLDEFYVFFAVKKNVDDIKRENFGYPQREDEYGTSVISIQFRKGKYNKLSIKNRYNDKVFNPDATFSNNLENIIHGLTYAFEETYNLKIFQKENANFNMPNYVRAEDGRFYKYNYCIANTYYCPNNIIIDNDKVIRDYNLKKERYILMDYFILDLQEKKLKLYDETINDAFLNDFSKINEIRVVKEGKQKIIAIDDNIIIKLDRDNRIISYINNKVKYIDDMYLYRNLYLKSISLSEVESTGLFFLNINCVLNRINVPKLKSIGEYFLYNNPIREQITLKYGNERNKVC